MKDFFKIFCFSILLSSCVSMSELEKFNKSRSNLLEEGKKEFIELADGTILEGNSVYIISKGSKDIVTIDGNTTNYESKNIVAIQRSNSYLRRNNLNGFFLDRIIKGKINIYRQEFSGHTSSVYNSKSNSVSQINYNPSYFYYLQKGDRAPVISYTDKLFEEMISDSPDALLKFNEYKKLSRRQKRINVNVIFDKIIRIYNGVK